MIFGEGIVNNKYFQRKVFMSNTNQIKSLVTAMLLGGFMLTSSASYAFQVLPVPGSGPTPQVSTNPVGPTLYQFYYANVCGVSGQDPCKIGTRGPGGGWIFFIDYLDQYPDFNYLEVAPTDASAGDSWCNDRTHSIFNVSGPTAYLANNGVGKGRSNTNTMLTVCSSGAAVDANNYSTPTTSPGDWFLPSNAELLLAFENLRQAGIGGFANSWYWSSTEFDNLQVRTQSFLFLDAGTQNNSLKSNLFHWPVRPILAFN